MQLLDPVAIVHEFAPSNFTFVVALLDKVTTISVFKLAAPDNLIVNGVVIDFTICVVFVLVLLLIEITPGVYAFNTLEADNIRVVPPIVMLVFSVIVPPLPEITLGVIVQLPFVEVNIHALDSLGTPLKFGFEVLNLTVAVLLPKL